MATVSYASTDDLQAVNLKKSIAAAFQANFKGTEEEEEIDPQSTHISHYRWGVVPEEMYMSLCWSTVILAMGGSC